MKLRDFANDRELKELRRMMGAVEDGTFTTHLKRLETLTEEELARLEHEGLDVTVEEIRRLKDGTLGYKNSRVLVYVRDVPVHGGECQLPKFHIAHCSSLYAVLAEDRFEQYVVTTRESGDFPINKVDRGGRVASMERLNVCQNCLHTLRFDDFSSSLSWPVRKERVKEFATARFFAKYQKSLDPRAIFDDDGTPLRTAV